MSDQDNQNARILCISYQCEISDVVAAFHKAPSLFIDAMVNACGMLARLKNEPVDHDMIDFAIEYLDEAVSRLIGKTATECIAEDMARIKELSDHLKEKFGD